MEEEPRRSACNRSNHDPITDTQNTELRRTSGGAQQGVGGRETHGRSGRPGEPGPERSFPALPSRTARSLYAACRAVVRWSAPVGRSTDK